MVGQVNGNYEVRKKNMKKYLDKVRSLISAFSDFDIQQISRIENSRADLLSKLAILAQNKPPKEVFFKVL